jgi:hypothetical protein
VIATLIQITLDDEEDVERKRAIDMSLEQSNAEVCIYLVEEFPAYLKLYKTTKDNSVEYTPIDMELQVDQTSSKMFNEQPGTHSSQATNEFSDSVMKKLQSQIKVCCKCLNKVFSY